MLPPPPFRILVSNSTVILAGMSRTTWSAGSSKCWSPRYPVC